MNVGQLLKTKGAEPVIVGPYETVGVTARLLAQKKKGLALVCDAEGKLLGVLSVIDINRAVADHAERAHSMQVRSMMTSNFCACQTGDSVTDALAMMTKHGVRHLPVLEAGVLKGQVNLHMLLEHRFEEAEIQADEMRKYVIGVGYH